MAEQWIGSRWAAFEAGTGVNFAIVRRADSCFIGEIGIMRNQSHDNAEMGYWIGKPYWNEGYGTEAAGAVIRYAFEHLGLNRVYAAHYTRNPPSGRILQKIDMTYEGCLRQQVKKREAYEDLEHYAIIRSEYQHNKR